MNDKDREPKIHSTARVDDSIILGDWSVVHAHTQIRGDVKIGRAAWIDPNVIIGGGQSERGSLVAGDFLHLGIRSFVNIADAVRIGDEVGLGMETKIFTHGAYLNSLDGFPFSRGPVTIGDHVWLPYATVLPNVAIGSNVVIAAMSLVNKDIPDGCLAGGVPVKVLQRHAYPTMIVPIRSIALLDIKADAAFYGIKIIIQGTHGLRVGKTQIHPYQGEIEGPVTKDSERVRDLLRRRGIRFRYYDNNGVYRKWD